MMQPPGFNLPRRQWIALNRLRTGHGRIGLMMHQWGLSSTPQCDCGHHTQSARHIVEECPTRAFPGGLTELNKDTRDGINWLEKLDISI